MHVCICSACFCVHAFLLWLVWDQCSTVDGAWSTLKMFNILIIQLPVKGGEMQRERESSREREGTCSNPGQIIRDYTNHAHIHLQSLLHIHSALLTAVWCSIRHIYYSPHSVIQKGGAFCARQQAGNLWHFCVVVCDCVSRSPLGDRLRAGRLSWEGGRVTLVTDMPKPDLLCLVQLLDGTIETFRVSVRKTHTRKHTHKHTDTCPFWADYMLLLSARALY